jgi:hypothetical protein
MLISFICASLRGVTGRIQKNTPSKKEMSVMKRIIAIAIFVLASLITIRSANAQDHKIRVIIPFNFNVDSTLLPAGTYTITSRDLITVLIQNGKQNVSLLRSAPVDDNKWGYNKLVFNKYGDQYFLSKILCSYANMNLELPVSKIAKTARPQEASLYGDVDTFLALNR